MSPKLPSLTSELHAAEQFNWEYLHGKPKAAGTLKASAEDFKVEEILGFELSREGEHHFLWVEKVDTNTAFVAEQLAKFSGIPLRDIGYAGRKDKFARTAQYFSVYQGKHSAPHWDAFSHPNISIIHHHRHNKKLRLGALQGNRFSLKLRNLENFSIEEFHTRIKAIQENGVPNYYGQQRFGQMKTSSGEVFNGNLHLGFRLAAGEHIKNRNKRSMAISALRSFLFNAAVSARIKSNLHQTILLDDALMLSGSNSYFLATKDEDFDQLRQRLLQRDILLTAPLTGDDTVKKLYAKLAKDKKCKPQSGNRAVDFEHQSLFEYMPILESLAKLGLKEERRSILMYPSDLEWAVDSNTLSISFVLPSGSFATSVVRELLLCR
ncbi:tRNA pseudouridine(13) synthase TruD [Ningiella sp. W23]|uniref:tRNA pseudouridine(13) synthase TruD n=1 Tax=Ningiella sp. W23 TaxID=3023715 RepID=UPI0037583FB2